MDKHTRRAMVSYDGDKRYTKEGRYSTGRVSSLSTGRYYKSVYMDSSLSLFDAIRAIVATHKHVHEIDFDAVESEHNDCCHPFMDLPKNETEPDC